MRHMRGRVTTAEGHFIPTTFVSLGIERSVFCLRDDRGEWIFHLYYKVLLLKWVLFETNFTGKKAGTHKC